VVRLGEAEVVAKECNGGNEERAKVVHEEKISTMSDGAGLQAPNARGRAEEMEHVMI